MSSPLKAVGISGDGLLFPIRSADGMRGLSLVSVIISADHVDWYRENEDIIRESFSWFHGKGVVTLLDGPKQKECNP